MKLILNVRELKLFMHIAYLDRYVDSSGVSGEIPSTFANLKNLQLL